MKDSKEVPSMKPGVVDSIEALFSLCKAIHENNLSTDDLAQGCEMAIATGHEMCQIQLAMMLRAVELASFKKG